MKKFSQIDFTDGVASKNLALLFMPLLIAFFLNIAFDMTDSLWIGNLLGEKALAAQTVSMPVILIFNAACMGATGGISILLSKYIGAGEKEKIDSTVASSFISVLTFVMLVTVFCELGINGILRAVGTPPEIYSMARGFLAIHMLSFPFVIVFMYLTAVLRSYGNSIIQMASIIVCTLLNAVFDPIFIGYMGMNGVAVATVLSEGVMMLLVLIYCLKKNIISVRLKAFHFRTLKDILIKAVPSMVQQSLPSISASFITSLVAGFGVLPIAAFGIACKLEILLLYPSMAINMALTTSTGQCFGAEDPEKAKKYLKWGVIYCGGLVLILSAVVTIFPQKLTALFGAGEEVSTLVKTYFTIIAAGYICNSVTNCVLGEINGFGRPATAMLIMVFYYIVVRMPLAKILAGTALGLNGIWAAVLISHAAAVIASIMYNRLFFRKKLKIVLCGAN
jgi:putative MATE family efflux protein